MAVAYSPVQRADAQQADAQTIGWKKNKGCR
jgi:hypothetical protein